MSSFPLTLIQRCYWITETVVVYSIISSKHSTSLLDYCSDVIVVPLVSQPSAWDSIRVAIKPLILATETVIVRFVFHCGFSCPWILYSSEWNGCHSLGLRQRRPWDLSRNSWRREPLSVLDTKWTERRLGRNIHGNLLWNAHCWCVKVVTLIRVPKWPCRRRA